MPISTLQSKEMLLAEQNSQFSDKINNIKSIINNRQPRDVRGDLNTLKELHELFIDSDQKFWGYGREEEVNRAKERVLRVQPLVANDFVSLDVGCGFGGVPYCLTEIGARKSYGIDLKERDIWNAFASEKQNLVLVKGDITDFYFAEHFDIITSFCNFEHLSDPASMLARCFDLAKTNGKMYIDFNPLFYSKIGAHLFRQISVPYFQNIFSDAVVNNFLGQDPSSNPYASCNKLSITDYLHILCTQKKWTIRNLSITLDYSCLWFVELLRNYIPYSDDDLYCSGMVILLEK